MSVMSYRIDRKFDVIEKFREFVKFTNSKFGVHISRFHTDNGGEFIGNAFRDLCQSEGIEIQFSEPYTHQHNGTMERFNRIVMNTTRVLLFQSGIPLKLRHSAFKTAVYLLHRSPNSRLMALPLMGSGLERNHVKVNWIREVVLVTCFVTPIRDISFLIL